MMGMGYNQNLYDCGPMLSGTLAPLFDERWHDQLAYDEWLSGERCNRSLDVEQRHNQNLHGEQLHDKWYDKRLFDQQWHDQLVYEERSSDEWYNRSF